MSVTNHELEYKILSQAAKGVYECLDHQSAEFPVAQYMVDRGFLRQETQAWYQITLKGQERLVALGAAGRR